MPDKEEGQFPEREFFFGVSRCRYINSIDCRNFVFCMVKKSGRRSLKTPQHKVRRGGER